jgi:hypothetical protein
MQDYQCVEPNYAVALSELTGRGRSAMKGAVFQNAQGNRLSEFCELKIQRSGFAQPSCARSNNVSLCHVPHTVHLCVKYDIDELCNLAHNLDYE